jgi:putative tricarboxylic transport membrane protein
MFRILTLIAAVFMFAPLSAESKDFPSKPIQIVVPFGPGGQGDVFTRMVLKAIETAKISPVPFVVLNKPGAGGSIGSRFVKNAKPDGHTLLALHQTLITSQIMGITDYGTEAFEPVAETHNTCIVWASSKKSKFDTFAKVVAASKANPNSVKVGTAVGTLSHLSGLIMANAANIKVNHVNVGGGKNRVRGLMGGHIDLAELVAAPIARPKSPLQGLVYMGEKRHPKMPNVPTSKELGHDAIACVNNWWFAPKGTPKDVIKTLASFMKRAVEETDLKQTISKRGQEAEFFTGPKLAARIAASKRSLAASKPK